MRLPKTLLALSLPVFAGLFGCASIDVPEKPALPDLTSQYAAPEQQFFNAEGDVLPLNRTWWAEFGDAALTQLIDAALSENRQLSVAEANIRIAQANLQRRTFDQSFSISGSGSLDSDASIAPDQSFNTSARLGLNAGWEYDAFGRIASAITAAELGVTAAEQARQDVAVIVASETALAYTDLRGAQQRLKVAQSNADVQSQSLELLNDLLENGRATELDRRRAEAQYRTTRAALPRLEATVDAALSRLAVLTGSSASSPNEDLISIVQTAAPIPERTGPLMTGTPETLLRRRPDIRQAETEIARRLVLSDIERARLFPQIRFDAGIAALFNGNLPSNDFTSIGLGFGPSISWEGPDLRRVRADIAIADAETERAYAVYQDTVLQALSDVEIALSNSSNELKRRDDLTRAVDAAQGALELAQLRFEEGLDDFLDVLDAQRTLLDTEDRLAESKLQTTRLFILTYRELAGI